MRPAPWVRPSMLLAGILAVAAGELLAGCGNPRAATTSGDACLACHGSDGEPGPAARRPGRDLDDPARSRGAPAPPPRHRDPRSASLFRVPRGSHEPEIAGAHRWRGRRLGPLAAARGALPSWNATEARCSGVYCHGGTRRSARGERQRAGLDLLQRARLHLATGPGCVTCHGWPPPSPHPRLTSCGGCHGKTVTSDGRIDVAGGKHVNGTVDLGGSGGGSLACDACHGYPPPSGAHVKHFGWAAGASSGDLRRPARPRGLVGAGLLPATFGSYVFGCGNCHPVEAARHMDGCLEVTLAGAGAPAGSVKARTPPRLRSPARRRQLHPARHRDLLVRLLPLERPARRRAGGDPGLRRHARLVLRARARLRLLPCEPAALFLGRPGHGHRQLPPGGAYDGYSSATSVGSPGSGIQAGSSGRSTAEANGPRRTTPLPSPARPATSGPSIRRTRVPRASTTSTRAATTSSPGR